MFIAVDGIDGAGKSTLVLQLAEILEPLSPITTKEPTDRSHWGQALRQAAVTGRLPRETETEYFRKDRIYHVKHVIRPHLEKGHLVITDRYVDSTLAFQTDTPEEADDLYLTLATEILIPDITFILKCEVRQGLERIERQRGKLTKFETPEILERAKAIYESRQGPNYEFIDASRSIEHTKIQAIEILVRRFSHLQELIDAHVSLGDDNPGSRSIAR